MYGNITMKLLHVVQLICGNKNAKNVYISKNNSSIFEKSLTLGMLFFFGMIIVEVGGGLAWNSSESFYHLLKGFSWLFPQQ
jgi:hypothetical protein